MKMYENWKIKKSDLEEKQEEYSQVAEWCNETGAYAIQEIDDEYCVVKIPEPTIEEQNEQIRQIRQSLFSQYADPLKYDYEECVARYGETDERTIEAKNLWLDKKDEIREQNPYIEV
jgi:hypothetical protein